MRFEFGRKVFESLGPVDHREAQVAKLLSFLDTSCLE
jgi:hypothetical protein